MSRAKLLAILRPTSSIAFQKTSPTSSTFSRFVFGATSNYNNMATSSKVQLSVNDTGIFEFNNQNAETASKTSELLQENHDKYHIFFNSSNFHNHISHQLLTLYGTGAPAEIISQHYKNNQSYQLPHTPVQDEVVKDLSDPESFQKYLGRSKYYHSYLIFFQQEIDTKEVSGVLNEYVFAGDARANDMLVRMYAGLLHPLIHLGFGLEFNQPAIVAEALAQAAVHENWIGDFLYAAEKAANPTSKSLPQILDEIRADETLSSAAHWEDANKIRHGILARAPDKMIEYASQWTVNEEQLEQKTCEMIHSAVYFTAASQRPPKQVKFDFSSMHSTNSSIFFPTFSSLPWLSIANKIRLLEWKGRLDLAVYASCRSPPLLLEEISGYTPQKLEAGDAEWKGLFQRLWAYEDDGHAIKLGRAVAYAERASKDYEGEDWARIKGFMWEKVGNMVVDSVEDSGATWVRGAGFEEAWIDYEDRPRQDHL